MKTDDFEKRLQCQPLQTPPAAWREEILTAARANLRKPESVEEAGLLTGWRALLARIPVAWGAVAALWLVIIGANSLMSGPASTMVASSPGPASHEPMTVWNLQRAEYSLLVNHQTDAPELSPAPRRPAVPPPPRSDIRRDGGFGSFVPGHLTTLA